jgi:hypothetical protein
MCPQKRQVAVLSHAHTKSLVIRRHQHLQTHSTMRPSQLPPSPPIPRHRCPVAAPGRVRLEQRRGAGPAGEVPHRRGLLRARGAAHLPVSGTGRCAGGGGRGKWGGRCVGGEGGPMSTRRGLWGSCMHMAMAHMAMRSVGKCTAEGQVSGCGRALTAWQALRASWGQRLAGLIPKAISNKKRLKGCGPASQPRIATSAQPSPLAKQPGALSNPAAQPRPWRRARQRRPARPKKPSAHLGSQARRCARSQGFNGDMDGCPPACPAHQWRPAPPSGPNY